MILGCLAGRHGDPEVHRGRTSGVAQPLAPQDVEQQRALPPVRPPGASHVALVAPGDDRRPLDELLRRGAHIRPEPSERGDQLGIARHEAAAEPGHRRPLREGVERDDAGQVGELERGGGRLVEPELAVRLVGGQHEPVLAGEPGEPLEKRTRRDRARRVVRRVQPDDGGAFPEPVRGRIEVGEEPGFLAERQLDHARAGEGRAASGYRIPGLGDDDGVATGGRVQHDLREREDRLLRPERRDHLCVRVETDAEAAIDPACDRLAQLG